VGAADRKKLPEYGPLGTGCPAIERAVAALYKGQNEESFWALMNAINYALELDTRVPFAIASTILSVEIPFQYSRIFRFSQSPEPKSASRAGFLWQKT